MSVLKRTSLTLDSCLIDDLDYVASRMGVSRSALLSNIAGAAAKDLRTLLEGVPMAPTEVDTKRFKGASIELVRERLETLEDMQDGDIFGK